MRTIVMQSKSVLRSNAPAGRILYFPSNSRRWLCQTAAIYYLQLSPTLAIDNPRSFVVAPGKSCFRSTTQFLVAPRRSYYSGKQTAPKLVLSAAQNLVSRLEEWEPNIAPPSTALGNPIASASQPIILTVATTTNAQSVEEYARSFCTGYLTLPPLKLGWIANNPFQKETNTQEWECQRTAVLYFLAKDCGLPSSPALTRMLQDIQTQPMEKNLRDRLQRAWTPKFVDFFQCLMEQSSGQTIPMLVQLRGDILRLMTVLPNDNAQLRNSFQELEKNIRQLLSTWFSPGLLEIRRITYNTTSAGIIEKIAIKEAVHPMKSLDDLRKRLGPERRVFALFHPLMPDEPLVILHVHLETKPNHIPSSMPHVLTEELSNMPFKPLVATFYSISNTQNGLTRGLGLGEFLIKQAVRQLQQEFPSDLQTFVTLSPMPAFRKWVEGIVSSKKASDHEWAKDLAAGGVISPALIQQFTLARPILQDLVEFGNSSDDNDINIEDQLEKTRDVLMQLAAHYLVTMKNVRSGKPLDPVAGFHVGNGAEVFRINFAADLSRKGLLRSFGVMVNYRYQLDSIETNKAKVESSRYHLIPVSVLVQDLLPSGA